MKLSAFWQLSTDQQQQSTDQVFLKVKDQCKHKALLHRQPPAITQCMDCGREFPRTIAKQEV